ncbi:hypothetical protein ACET3Z_020016 [Daucus carota]
MSNNYEYLNNVHSGRTDWKVKVRIIREWRGVTITGQPYKGYNLLLLDAKNVRMEAFVPLFLMEKLQKVFILGKMYAISNFQVKNYTETDKWRCVTTDRQIQFTNQTRAKELGDNDYFIAKNCFEFCDLGDIKSFANQTKYLADVVGVVTRREDLKLVHTKQGVDKYQIRMTIADGRFAIIIVAKDETGEINILLMDRPIRKLFGKTVLEMEEEEKGKFPATFKTMEKGIYTIKLEIREFNIKEKEEMYIGNDIYQGSYMVPKMKERKFTVQQATEISQAQSSGTSIHLDNISQL